LSSDFDCHPILSEFEIIQLQRENSAAKSNVERCFSFCKYWGNWHCH